MKLSSSRLALPNVIDRPVVPMTCALLCLCACVSTVGPAQQQHPFAKTLHVCQGLTVSNAPAQDASRQIKNYQSFQQLRGNILATAPAAGCLSSGFGARRGGAGNIHKGIDLYTNKPVRVFAAGDGQVSFIGKQRGYGNIIELTHKNGVKTRYAHLSKFNEGLKAGHTVKSGQQIGISGRTGNATAIHLHYEILINEKQRNPLGL